MKGKDAQSLEKLFKRKFELIEKLTVNSEINAENIAKLEKMQNMIHTAKSLSITKEELMEMMDILYEEE